MIELPMPSRPIAPPPALSDADLLDAMLHAPDGAPFVALWRGDTSAHVNLAAADAALAGLLLTACHGNVVQAERLFKFSPLYDAARFDDSRGARLSYGAALFARAAAVPANGNGPLTAIDAFTQDALDTIPPPKQVLRWAAEAWEPRPARQMIVDGFIGPGDVMVLAGEGGVGKTWIVCDLAISVADRQPWLGRAVTQAPVLIVDEESGERRLFDRLERTMRGHGIKPGTPVLVAFASYAGWDFRELADGDRLAGLIRETNAGLVVIDALVDTMLGGDENSAGDIATVFHTLRSVAQKTGAAIIVLHHLNKAGAYRGSTAIRGAVESLIVVGKLNEAGTLLRIESDKLRDSEPFSFGAKMCFDKLTNTFRLDLAEVRERGSQFSAGEKYVLRVLTDAGAAGAGMAAIIGKADSCSPESARKAVYALVARGFVERIDAGGSGRVPGIWALVAGNPINI